MKLRLNKQTLSQMPTQVREIVTEWKARHNKAFITVENTNGFYPSEDAKVSMINLLTEKQQTARVAGEFAGMTPLSPTAKVPLTEGMVAVVTGFFCGHPYLNIYQGGNTQIG